MHTPGLLPKHYHGLTRLPRNVLPKAGGIQSTRRTQGATEGPPPLREVEAGRITVQGGTATRQPTTEVRDEDALDRYDA
jgi:hypothetical protein